MSFHSGFKRVNGDIIKGPLDVKKDSQSVVTIENRFLYVTNDSAKSYVARVVFPKGMLIVMHGRGYEAGLFSFPEHELLKSFEEE